MPVSFPLTTLLSPSVDTCKGGLYLWFSRSVVLHSGTPCTIAHPGFAGPSLSPGVCSSSCELMTLSNHLILCHPLLMSSVFPSVKVFSSKSALGIRWPKYWSFSFSISPSNEYSVLISFRIDWFDLLAIQETFKNLLQHHNLKASILWHSAFFMVQLLHPYMTTGKP